MLTANPIGEMIPLTIDIILYKVDDLKDKNCVVYSTFFLNIKLIHIYSHGTKHCIMWCITQMYIGVTSIFI